MSAELFDAFALQRRRPRAVRIAIAYGTENLRPSDMVNCVTFISCLVCSQNSVTPTRISFSGSSVHSPTSRAYRVLSMAAPRRMLPSFSNCPRDDAVAVRSIIIMVGTAFDLADETLRISTSRGSNCSITDQAPPPGIGPNGTLLGCKRFNSSAKNIQQTTSLALLRIACPGGAEHHTPRSPSPWNQPPRSTLLRKGNPNS